MRTGCFCVVSVLAAFCVTAAPPKATVTAFSQDPATGEVSVSYTVDGDSIVTAEFLSAGEALACEEYCDRLAGEINREVTAGKTYVFKWSPDSSGNGIDLSGKALEVRLTAWDRLSPPPYMALDLTITNNVAYYASSNAVPGGVHDFRYKSDYMLMRRIPAKNVVWKMGMSSTAKAYDTWSLPGYHKVKLSHDYYIGVFAVTQRQHERLTGARFWNAFCSEEIVDGTIAYMGRPALGVSYEQIRGVNDGSGWPDEDFETAHAVDEDSFVHKARALTGKLLDLPTEAQWEFACRSGCAADVYTGKWIISQAERTYTYDHGFVARCHQNSNYQASGFDPATDCPTKAVRPRSDRTCPTGSDFTICLEMCANGALTGIFRESRTRMRSRWIMPVRQTAPTSRRAECSRAALIPTAPTYVPAAGAAMPKRTRKNGRPGIGFVWLSDNTGGWKCGRYSACCFRRLRLPLRQLR